MDFVDFVGRLVWIRWFLFCNSSFGPMLFFSSDDEEEEEDGDDDDDDDDDDDEDSIFLWFCLDVWFEL